MNEVSPPSEDGGLIALESSDFRVFALLSVRG